MKGVLKHKHAVWPYSGLFVALEPFDGILCFNNSPTLSHQRLPNLWVCKKHRVCYISFQLQSLNTNTSASWCINILDGKKNDHARHRFLWKLPTSLLHASSLWPFFSTEYVWLATRILLRGCSEKRRMPPPPPLFFCMHCGIASAAWCKLKTSAKGLLYRRTFSA